jgi:hypothetical protein
MEDGPAARDFDSIARSLLSNARSDGGRGMLLLHHTGSNRQRESPAILARSGLNLTGLAQKQGWKAWQSLERSGLYLTGADKGAKL